VKFGIFEVRVQFVGNFLIEQLFPGEHFLVPMQTPPFPCLVRALPDDGVVGCRGRLRQRPSLRLCCCCSKAFALSRASFFFVFFFPSLIFIFIFSVLQRVLLLLLRSLLLSLKKKSNFFFGGGEVSLDRGGVEKGLRVQRILNKRIGKTPCCMLGGSGARWGYGKRFSIGFGGTYHFRSLGVCGFCC
jgi:hypothetical protein